MGRSRGLAETSAVSMDQNSVDDEPERQRSGSQFRPEGMGRPTNLHERRAIPMALVRWRPFRELEMFRREIDRLFDEIFEREFPAPRRAREITRVFVPAVDMYEKPDEIVLKAELPGMNRDDINIELTEDAITISGEIKREEEVKEADYYCAERTYGRFSRTIDLPVKVNMEKAEATYKDGLLEIRLPKAEEAKRKEIKLKVK